MKEAPKQKLNFKIFIINQSIVQYNYIVSYLLLADHWI